MAVIAGYLATPPTGGIENSSLSAQLSAFDTDYWPTHVVEIPLPASEDVVSNIPVSANVRALSGSIVSGYKDDFYFHLIATPTLLDLGNLLSVQTRELSLWNAFLEPVDVTSLLVSDTNGFSITAPAGFDAPPFVLAPLQEITYSVTATLDGPPNLDTSITWASDHGGAVTRVLGSRVIVFPFLPDWRAGIDETVSARSSVLRAPDGTEQSISLRERFRRGYGISYQLKAVEAQMADNLLFGWQGRTYGVPAWPEQDYLTAPTAAGSDTLTFSTVNKTIRAGGLVMVFSRKDVLGAEIREVLAVTSSSVTTKTPFASDWTIGSRVVPLLLAAAEAQLQASRLVPTYLQVGIQFDLQPLSTDDNAPLVAPPMLYRGYELYLGRTNWRDGLGVSMQTDVQRIDLQTGVFRLVPQSGYSNMGRSHVWFLKTMADAAAFRQWLKRRYGKTVGVWMPSAMDDFTMATVTAGTTTTVVVKTNGYASMVKQHASRRDVFIRLRDGTFFARRINDSLDNGDGTTQLTLDEPLGVLVDPVDVMQFSLLMFYRMASDETSIHWHAPGKGEAMTGLISTEALQ